MYTQERWFEKSFVVCQQLEWIILMTQFQGEKKLIKTSIVA